MPLSGLGSSPDRPNGVNRMRRLAWMALGLASLVPGGWAVAGPQDGPPVIVTGSDGPALPPVPPIITPAQWLNAPVPTFPEPAKAINAGTGRVRLACVVSTAGRLTDCTILQEVPLGAGFGEAALAATPGARVTPSTVDGVPVPTPVRFNVDFYLQD